MELEDLLNEYLFYCEEKGLTKKKMINKRQELRQLKQFLLVKRRIHELENV
ncbi:hypothetical protein ACFSO7_06580 [Bacillus sp. CGMCC 1.16607]|uniref:hypothetical protein n=1 Tax=Bacillus sp. CGMCC 1.16607 TaxID=3351842 RepID=UPI003629F60E